MVGTTTPATLIRTSLRTPTKLPSLLLKPIVVIICSGLRIYELNSISLTKLSVIIFTLAPISTNIYSIYLRINTNTYGLGFKYTRGLTRESEYALT